MEDGTIKITIKTPGFQGLVFQALGFQSPGFQALRRLLAATMAAFMFLSAAANPVLSQTLSQSLGQTLPTDTIVIAQSETRDWDGEIDIDPPVIDHEALETGVPGQAQTFSASVVDDRGLKHVWLFHRDRSGAQYSSVAMQRVDSTSEYIVTIDSALGQNSIEYYIEAVDTGGNRVLKGFPFFPLVRQLGSGVAEPAAPTQTVEQDSKLIYVLLGVAALGLGLALLGGDDGSESGPVVEPGTVPLTIIVQPPE